MSYSIPTENPKKPLEDKMETLARKGLISRRMSEIIKSGVLLSKVV